MKRITALICAFFVMFSSVCSASYTGAEIYNTMESAFAWLGNNIFPLGGTDSRAADYYVMALKRAGRVFEYNKYADITASRKPLTVSDAHRIIMANTASGGKLTDKFIAKSTHNLKTATDIAGAITSVLSGEYKAKDINKFAVALIEKQNSDGGFEDDTLVTAKSIIALSFLSGNRYIVKGEGMGEKYIYDVNAVILRGVNYLQNSKATDFGFGSVQNTAYAVMALDSAGVDADNDPGFSDDNSSTFNALISHQATDGGFGSDDDTAIAVCALVSHLRAMQDNTMFFALRTEDMPYNPNEYIEDLNYSGQGLKVETQTDIEVSYLQSGDDDATPFEISDIPPVDNDAYTHEQKPLKIMPIVVIVLSVLILSAAVVWFVVYMLNIKPMKKYHKKETEDEDD